MPAAIVFSPALPLLVGGVVMDRCSAAPTRDLVAVAQHAQTLVARRLAKYLVAEDAAGERCKLAGHALYFGT